MITVRAEVVDTQGVSQLDSLHYAEANWTLKYGERYKLMLYGVQEQIKA